MLCIRSPIQVFLDALRKMVRRAASIVVLLLLAAPVVWTTPRAAEDDPRVSRLDPALRARAAQPRGLSRVIIETTDGGPATSAIKAVAAKPGRHLRTIGQVALVPDTALEQLASRPEVRHVSLDRRVQGTLERTSASIGASWVREKLGFDGTGIGVAIIDSGVANWHDDLGADRVVHFADFVTHLPQPHDEYGHGTHVAGIIAGNGFDSGGARRGVAPGASLIVLKVLDADGDGFISNVIAAIDYAIEQRLRLNLRVLNLSVAAGVYESFTTDPFTLAAKRAVDSGIIVVTSAGNLGRSDSGQVQIGGITAPGNAPWVLTVGASNHQRTITRADDTVAPFSSRGPTNIDRAAKPDLVAPGVAIESLAAAGSTIYNANPRARLAGTVDTPTPPYLAMTGTSMAAPVVAGTIALMLQANPALTPNLVKGILEYTAEHRARVDLAAQGAGFLNARGAVQLALALRDGENPLDAARGGSAKEVDPTSWSRHILWGNERVRGGALSAAASAWRADVTWGAPTTPEGDDIAWGAGTDGAAAWKPGGNDSTALEDGVALVAWNPMTDAAIDSWREAASPALPWRAVAAALPPERRRRSYGADETGGYRP